MKLINSNFISKKAIGFIEIWRNKENSIFLCLP